MGKGETVALNEEAVKGYLDECIRYWRKERDKGNAWGHVYVDAYQSVREALFGEDLPLD